MHAISRNHSLTKPFSHETVLSRNQTVLARAHIEGQLRESEPTGVVGILHLAPNVFKMFLSANSRKLMFEFWSTKWHLHDVAVRNRNVPHESGPPTHATSPLIQNGPSFAWFPDQQNAAPHLRNRLSRVSSLVKKTLFERRTD